MKWNWQQADWPNFNYDQAKFNESEKRLLLGAGLLFGAFKHLDDEDKRQLTIELISNEALKTSAIEGEYLDRDSLQSSIQRQFGLITDNRKISAAEQGIAEVMVDLYRNFEAPLSHTKLFEWHSMLTNGRRDLNDIGRYRTHTDPMQIVSGALYAPKVHFEAPCLTLKPTEPVLVQPKLITHPHCDGLRYDHSLLLTHEVFNALSNRLWRLLHRTLYFFSTPFPSFW